VHFLEAAAFALDIDQHRRVDTRYARRSDQHVAEQAEGPGRAARCDCAHIPHGGALCVQIGGDDQKAPAPAVFGGDLLEHRFVDIARDQPLERFGLEYACAEDGRKSVELEQLLTDPLGEQVLEHGIVGGTEEREWRDEGSGACAGHDRELGSCAAIRPTREQAGTVSPVGAPAGYRQHIDRAVAPRRIGAPVGFGPCQQRVGAIIRPCARVWNARDACDGLLVLG